MKLKDEQWRAATNWIPYKWFKEMEEMAKQSQFDGHERGFTMCMLEDGTVRKTDPCKGEKCSVMPPSCEPYEETVGYYHTHPHGLRDFSVGDSNYALSKKERVQCVGTVVKTEDLPLNIEMPKFVVKCAGWWLEHPLYEHHKKKIQEISDEVHKLELSMAKLFYEQHKEIPREMSEEHYAKKREFQKRLETAEGVGVAIKPWGSQGIDESFGEVTRKMVEHARDLRKK